MNIREMTGLTFLIAGIIIAPFFYWLSVRWLIVAFVLICIGAVLFYTSRVIKNEGLSQYPSSNAGTGTPNVPIVGEARGFPGHQFSDPDSGGSDGD